MQNPGYGSTITETVENDTKKLISHKDTDNAKESVIKRFLVFWHNTMQSSLTFSTLKSVTHE